MTIAALATLSFGLTVWQWIVAWRFPLHRRSPDSSYAPGVTLLKPLKGCDTQTEACLRSWLDQQYRGPVQILFGVASLEDPVCGLVRQLLAAYPKADAELVICAERLGANAKISTLVQLEKLIAHEVVIVSDADVWAPADLLTNVVTPFRSPEVGLVNCFYALANPSSPAMHWEAVAVNADFWSQVLQSQSLKPLDFALGAVMATTRRQLERIGGFASLLEYLADDYQLGHKIAEGGSRIVLCPVVVQCKSGPLGWRAVWRHQLRWARTIRVCQPVPFFFSILSNGTLWPLLWLVLAPSTLSFGGALLFWGTRWCSAQSNYRRLTGGKTFWRLGWLVLFKDLVGVALWLLAFAGNEIEWRGHRYRMLRDGRLAEL